MAALEELDAMRTRHVVVEGVAVADAVAAYDAVIGLVIRIAVGDIVVDCDYKD